MRRIVSNITLSISLLLAIASCGEGVVFTNAGEADDEKTADSDDDGSSDEVAHVHGTVFQFEADHTDEDAEEEPDFEAGAETVAQTIEADEPFRGVTFHVTAANLALEYRVVDESGDAGEWERLEPEQSHGRFHSGFAAFDQEADALEFRSDTPIDYLRVELFDEPVDTADAHDEHGFDRDEETRTQELAAPGKYDPSASVRQAGAAQTGNFAYESAPPWNGGANCSGRFLPGAADLGNFLVNHFDGATHFQGYNCRPIRGSTSMSMHGTGRAIDVFVPVDTSQPYNNQADNDLGNPIADYIIENATELGVQFFIWDQAKWSISYGEVRSYGGVHPHHDHLHIELTKSAANQARSNFPGQGPQFEPPFADDDGHTHEEAIEAIYEAGVTRGCQGGSTPRYCPDRKATRAMLAIMFMRAFDLPRDGQDYFDDDDGSPAEPAINSLAYHGITEGCRIDHETNDFCPGREVTRRQFALMLDRALRLDDATGDHFTDDDGADYEAAANRLAEAGITNGCAPDRFCGQEKLTRAHLAAFLARAMGLVDGYGSQEVDHVPHFADDDGNIHEDAINDLYEAGIVRGCNTGSPDAPHFCPDRDLSRVALAIMTTRAFDVPESDTNHFPDDDGYTGEDHIDALAEAGITKGCNGGDEFCSGDGATLRAVALFLVRAADGYSNHNVDSAGMSDVDAIETLEGWGVIDRPGCDNPSACAGDVVTRDQAAALFQRTLKYVGIL